MTERKVWKLVRAIDIIWILQAEPQLLIFHLFALGFNGRPVWWKDHWPTTSVHLFWKLGLESIQGSWDSKHSAERRCQLCWALAGSGREVSGKHAIFRRFSCRFSCKHFSNFQENLLKTMIQIEDSFFDLARSSHRNCLVICDRGAMDASAFISREQVCSLLNCECKAIFKCCVTNFFSVGKNLVTAGPWWSRDSRQPVQSGKIVQKNPIDQLNSIPEWIF